MKDVVSTPPADSQNARPKAPRARSNVTYAAPKYGPTSHFGTCEADGCTATARTTCAACDTDVCRSHHVDHLTHGAG